jgi:hypothetical protein
MSFADGFTKGFISSYQQASSDVSQSMRIRAKEDADRIRKKQEELDKATKADQDRLSAARTLAQNFGQESDEAVMVIANQLKAGVTPAALMSGFASGRLSFTGSPSGATTQNAVYTPGDEDEQTMDAFDAVPEDAQVFNFGGTSQTASQPSGASKTAPAVPYSPQAPSSAPRASGGSTAPRSSGSLGIQVNPNQAKAPTPNLAVAYDQLRAAEESGDQDRITQAQARVDQLLDAEAARGAARGSGEIRQFVKVDESGKPQFTSGYIRQTAQGPVMTDAQGQPLQGFRPVMEDERKAGDEALKVINTRLTKYNEDLQNVGSALVLADDVINIVSQTPEVLTRVAGGVQSLTSFVREVGTAASLVGNLIETSQNKEVTREQFEANLNSSGVLPQGLTVDQLEGLNLSSITNLSERKALFDAKVFLLAFRSGALEGQSGQAMSDKDYQRLLKIVYASSNPETFQQQLNDYVRQGVSTLERTSNSLNNSRDGLIGRFQQQYGYNPVAAVVSPVKDYLASDPRALAAYERVMATRGVGAPQPTQPAATPTAAPQPTAQPAQSGPVTISSDEEYQKLPSGAEFIGPDGVKRRKP